MDANNDQKTSEMRGVSPELYDALVVNLKVQLGKTRAKIVLDVIHSFFNDAKKKIRRDERNRIVAMIQTEKAEIEGSIKQLLEEDPLDEAVYAEGERIRMCELLIDRLEEGSDD